MSKPLIQVVGSLHIDFTTVTSRCPGPGETIEAKRLEINPGGKGANQAVGCGRASFVSEHEQDVDVEMIGAVGKNDPYVAKLLQPSFAKSGVNTRGVVEVENSTTGCATIIVDEGANGENRILFVPGADYDGMRDVDDVLRRSKSGGRLPDVVLLQGEVPRETVIAVIEHYNSTKSTQVIFNPAPVWPEGVPSSTLQNLAVLVVNETECALLAKSLAHEGLKIKVVNEGTELEQDVLADLARQFHELLHLQTIIVTLGGKGVFFSQITGYQGLIPGVKVPKVVDTTAAGDTFVGYFAAELARSVAAGRESATFDVEATCVKANAAAAKCVARSGAMQSIPYGYE